MNFYPDFPSNIPLTRMDMEMATNNLKTSHIVLSDFLLAFCYFGNLVLVGLHFCFVSHLARPQILHTVPQQCLISIFSQCCEENNDDELPFFLTIFVENECFVLSNILPDQRYGFLSYAQQHFQPWLWSKQWWWGVALVLYLQWECCFKMSWLWWWLILSKML